MSLATKMSRAQVNTARFFLRSDKPADQRRALKWARTLDGLLVRPGGPFFFLRRMGGRPHGHSGAALKRRLREEVQQHGMVTHPDLDAGGRGAGYFGRDGGTVTEFR